MADDVSMDTELVPVEKPLLHATEDKHQVALERCASYKDAIADHLAVKYSIKTSIDLAEEHCATRARIL